MMRKLFCLCWMLLALSFGGCREEQPDRSVEATKQQLVETIQKEEKQQSGIATENEEKLQTRDTKTEEEDSRFTSVTCSMGELTEDKRKAKVTIAVVLKRSIDNIKMTLQAEGESAELKKEGRIYRAEIPVDIFLDRKTNPVIVAETQNETWTEALEEINFKALWNDYLPKMSVESEKDGWHYEQGVLSVDTVVKVNGTGVSNKEELVFERYTLEVYVGDKLISQEDVTSKLFSHNHDEMGGELKVKEENRIESEEKLSIYVVAEDSYGYIHRAQAYEWCQTPDGVTETTYGLESIYDREGNILNSY